MKKLLILIAVVIVVMGFTSNPNKVFANIEQDNDDPYQYSLQLNFSDVSFGKYHNIALSYNGDVYTWGENFYGSLGNGTEDLEQFPINITDSFNLTEGEKIIGVRASDSFSFAWTSTGRIFSWGKNFYNQLAHSLGNYTLLPRDITSQFPFVDGEKVIRIELGGDHGILITSESRVFTWGYNHYSQLGNDSDTSYDSGDPTPNDITSYFSLSENEKIEDIALSDLGSALLTSNGRVFSWGDQGFSLSAYDQAISKIPLEFTEDFDLYKGERIVEIDAGLYHLIFRTSIGRIFTRGDGNTGSLATGNDHRQWLPQDVTDNIGLSDDERVISIKAGGYTSAVITNKGNGYVWGLNSDGQLGLGHNDNVFLPTKISSNQDDKIVEIHLGSKHSAYLTESRSFMVSGNNLFGQLGLGHRDSVNVRYDIKNNFETVKVLTDFYNLSNVYLSGYNGAAVTDDGLVFAWGYNAFETVGDGTSINRYSPFNITSNFGFFIGETLANIEHSEYSALALSTNQRVFTWGFGGDGLLGQGSFQSSSVPIDITSKFNLNTDEFIRDIELSHFHAGAISSEGRVFTWGFNSYGQLGNGSSTKSNIPIDITSNFNLDSGEEIIDISFGLDFSAALTSYGKIFTWGLNIDGQLGDGTFENRLLPKDVTSQFNLNLGEMISEISLSYMNTIAITNQNRLFSWGENTFNHIGNNLDEDENTPVDITESLSLNENESISMIDTSGGLITTFYIITSENRLLTWGANILSDVNGYPNFEDIPVPTDISNTLSLNADENIIDIELAYYSILIKTSNDRFIKWGNNTDGVLAEINEEITSPITWDLYKIRSVFIKEYFEVESLKTVNIFPYFDFTEMISTITINNRIYLIDEMTINNGRISISTSELNFPIEIQSISLLDGRNISDPSINNLIVYFDQQTNENIFSDFFFQNQTIDCGTEDINWSESVSGVDSEVTVSEIYDNVNYNLPGSYVATIQLDDGQGQVLIYDFLVNVVDDTPPSFDQIETQHIEVGSITFKDWRDLINNPEDNSEGELILSVDQDNVDFTQIGVYTVVVSVEDVSGNLSSQEFDVVIQDTTKPEVNLKPGIDTLTLGETFTDYGILVNDVTDTTIEVIGEVDTSTPGTYRLTYRVRDTSGNETLIDRYITIYNPNPKIEFILGNTQTTIQVGEPYIDGTCQISIDDTVDVCEIKNDTVDTTTTGVYTITYSYTYEDKEYTYNRYVFVIDGVTPIEIYLPTKKEEGVEQ